MGGFAALIGGLGQGAQQYGQQVRGFLENRRENLANALLSIATQEPDPQLRGEYFGHVSKLLSGEPMAKMIPAIGKTVQDHAENDNALAQIFPPPGGPATGPGQAVGVQPGQPVIKPETPPPSAAMYPTSPVNPLAQGGQEAAGLSPMVQAPGPVTQSPFSFAPNAANIPGTTLPEGSAPQARMSAVPPINPYAAGPENAPSTPPTSRLAMLLNHPYMRTPAGRAILAPVIQQESELERTRAMAEYEVGLRRDAFQQLQKSPYWQALPDIYKAQLQFETALPTGAISPIPTAGMLPHVISNSTPGDQLPDGTLTYDGQLANRDANTLYRVERIPLTNQVYAVPITPPTAVEPTSGGGFGIFNKFSGQSRGNLPGAAPVALLRRPIVNLQGGGQAYGPSQLEAISQAATQQGKLTGGLPAPMPIPGAVNYTGLPTIATTTTEQTESGTKATSVRQKGLPGAVGGGGSQPAPPAPRGTQPIQPPAGENTPPSTTGAPAPIAKIPGVNYDQVAAAVAQVTRPNLSIAESKALEEKLGVSSTGALAKTPFARAYRQLMRQKAVDDPNGLVTWDAPIAAMAQRSAETLSEIADIKKLIARMQQNGELGLVMTRWNAFWTNHLGADLSRNQDYVALANHINLLTTAMGFVHGGARGGGSIQMKNSFQKDLNVEKMDAPTLLGAINAEQHWLETYANPAKMSLAPITPASGGSTGGGQIENWVRDASGRLVRQQ